MERLTGSIEDIRFRNDENGYTVLVVDADGLPVTVAGNMPPVTPGDCVEFEGEFVIHPRFGTQFKAVKAAVAQPKTEYGIIKFLSSGLIEGCGEKTAVRIVEKFGTAAIDIMEKDPQRLAEVKGISRAKAERMSASFEKVRYEREAVMFLAGYGVSVNLALKLYANYGSSTISVVKANPYVLVEDVDGVGFLTADKIARSMGIPDESEFRIRAGLMYALKTACEKEGNTYLPREKLFEETAKLLHINDGDKLSLELERLLVERKVVLHGDGVMSAYYYKTEHSAAVKLVKRVDASGFVAGDVSGIIDRFERTHAITLHERQREAVENAVASGVSVITGGPGTGKTTIINCILFVLDAFEQKCTLLAPTGRAAKRITEGCGREASTIHRALMGLDEGEKLNAAAVVVDEFSMVDIFLFRMLLDALSEGTKLVIVGDADQLPSVGSGNVLRDLIDSALVPVTRLGFVYRQSRTSLIAVSAHEINAGRMPDLNARDGDFFCFKCKTPDAVADMTVELATKRITDFCGIPPSRIQVVAALKNGVAGVNTLNARLQSALNGGAVKKVTVGDITFAEGDRVMHTVNNYELDWNRGSDGGTGVFNGDIGNVVFVSGAGDIEVEFEDGRRVMYTGDTRRQLILSYAVTVHKSQGCEFDAVVMPVVAGSPVIMTRNLLYTAITRAKKMAVLVGDEYNIKRMVDNNYVAERYSALKDFIDETKADMRKLYEEN